MNEALGVGLVVLLMCSIGLAVAYNRLRRSYDLSLSDRDGYLAVIERSNDALFVIDLAQGRILRSNAKAAELLGRSQDELTRLTIFELHPPEFVHRSADRIADAWERKGLVYEDIPLMDAPGNVVAVESSANVTVYKGRAAIILFVRDIRDRLALKRDLAKQQALVHEQNQQLLSSIRYAQRIQRAVLPEPEMLQQLVPSSFILFRPRDIVSGDLYWFAEQDGKVVVCAADCTGHGVPGALLSLIGASLFGDMVIDRACTDPAQILEGARSGMIQALNREEHSTGYHDGMNAAVVTLDRVNARAHYSGGFAPLYLVRGGEVIEYKGDRMPVGPHAGDMVPFVSHRIDLLPGDRLFVFSDGLQDQFGGPEGRKLRSVGLKSWITATAHLAMDDQHQAISDRFRLWKGRNEQVDDVLLIGLEI